MLTALTALALSLALPGAAPAQAAQAPALRCSPYQADPVPGAAVQLRAQVRVCTGSVPVPGGRRLAVRTDVRLAADEPAPPGAFDSFAVVTTLRRAGGEPVERRCDRTADLAAGGWRSRELSCDLVADVSAGSFTPSGQAVFDVADPAPAGRPSGSLPGAATPPAADAAGPAGATGPAVSSTATARPPGQERSAAARLLPWVLAAVVTGLVAGLAHHAAWRRRHHLGGPATLPPPPSTVR